MHDTPANGDLRDTHQRVQELSRRVVVDPNHKARLREELLRRHQELTAGSTQRAAVTLWPRLKGLKRLTLVAPPALAAAAAFSVLVWALQISGHQQPASAQAAPLIRALARTAPTVTGLRWTIHQHRLGSEPRVLRRQFPLNLYQRLYVRYNRTYLYSAGKWFLVTADTLDHPTMTDWQWAFAALPAQLDQAARFVPGHPINGHATEFVRYLAGEAHGTSIATTTWIDKQSGLVLRVDRRVMHGQTVVETDTVDYSYTRTP